MHFKDEWCSIIFWLLLNNHAQVWECFGEFVLVVQRQIGCLSLNTTLHQLILNYIHIDSSLYVWFNNTLCEDWHHLEHGLLSLKQLETYGISHQLIHALLIEACVNMQTNGISMRPTMICKIHYEFLSHKYCQTNYMSFVNIVDNCFVFITLCDHMVDIMSAPLAVIYWFS